MKFLSTICLLFALAAFAVPVVPQSVKFDANELVLNGTGTRKATIFKVRVYEAALYLKNKSSDADAILASPEPKQMDLRFVRSVDGSDIAEAWDSGFQKNCAAVCDATRGALAQLKSAMTDVKDGDLQSYRFDAKGVSYSLNGKEVLKIASPEFGRVLLSMWIGKEPPNADLRDGLLGGDARLKDSANTR